MFDMRRHANPSVFAPFVDRDSGRGKAGVCKGSYGHDDSVFDAFDPVVNGGSAIRAKIKYDSVTFIAYTDIFLRLPSGFDRVGSKARLGTKHTARTTLAGATVTDGYSDRLFSYR